MKIFLSYGPLAGVAGGKSLSFASPKESNQRKGAPAHPRNPENRVCRVGGKELAPLLIFLIFL
ncbi:MAG: hypothetical protein ACYCZA_13535 [Thiobacillus sp.]